MQATEEKTGYPSIDRPWLKYYDKNFLFEPLPQMDIYSYMKMKTEEYVDNIAISYYGKKFTYKDLYEKIDEASKVLLGIGVKENDRILFLMPNIPETTFLLYGAAQIGAVSDFVDPRPDSVDLKVSARKILSIFEEEKNSYIVALEQCYLGMLRLVENELRQFGLKGIIIVSASDSMNFGAKMNYLSEKYKFKGIQNVKDSVKQQKEMAVNLKEAFVKSVLSPKKYSDLVVQYKNEKVKRVQYQRNKLCVIVHTSGTSSTRPKPIPLTHDNMNVYVHQTYGGNMPMKAGDKALHILPFFAAFGIVDVVHAGLCHGNTLIEIPEFSINNLGKLIMKYKPQIVIGSPTWFLSMLNDESYKNADLSFFSMVTYGGDSMEVSDEEKINQFLREHKSKCILTKGHGMSETCGCASYAIGEYNYPGTVGIPMPNTIYALVNPETKELIRFEENDEEIEGELIISSPIVTSGILDGKVIVPHIQYDSLDYIYTRDIARMNKDGIMTFLSRSDRSFTRFDGFKIKPYEIENLLKQNPQIKYCVVSPFVDGEKHGNMAIADIVLESNNKMDVEEQIEFVKKLVNEQFIENDYVSSRQIPSKFRFRDEMPTTINGKIDYNKIIREGLNGEEICVELEETNISIGELMIYSANGRQ